MYSASNHSHRKKKKKINSDFNSLAARTLREGICEYYISQLRETHWLLIDRAASPKDATFPPRQEASSLFPGWAELPSRVPKKPSGYSHFPTAGFVYLVCKVWEGM